MQNRIDFCQLYKTDDRLLQHKDIHKHFDINNSIEAIEKTTNREKMKAFDDKENKINHFFFIAYKSDYFRFIILLNNFFSNKDFKKELKQALLEEIKINKNKEHLNSVEIYKRIFANSDLNDPKIIEIIKCLLDDVIN